MLGQKVPPWASAMISASHTRADIVKDRSQASKYSIWLHVDSSNTVIFNYQLTVGARWPSPDKAGFTPLLATSDNLHRAAKDLSTLQVRSSDDVGRKLNQEDENIRQKYGLKPSQKRLEQQLDRLEELVAGPFRHRA